MNDYFSESPEEVPPGPDDALEEVLTAPIEGMSAASALDYARDTARLQAALEARRLQAIHRYSKLRAEDEWSPDLLAAETMVSLARARRDVTLAQALSERLPSTMAALRSGALDRPRVESINHATSVLDKEKARRVDELLYPRALYLNPRQLAGYVRRLVVQIDPDGAEERARVRHEERRVFVEPVSDGMAWLNIFCRVEDALACKDRVDRIVKTLPADDPRTTDQRRADTIIDLIRGTTQNNTAAHVYVTVDAATLLGLNNLPGHLRGYGPLPAERVRELAYQLHAEWSGVLVDRDGRAQALAEKKYRFRGRLAEFIRLRDGTCDFPACNRSAQHTDIDHTQSHGQGGPTNELNGRCRCRHHHRAKQSPYWAVTQDGNTTTWTSDLGPTYTTTPPPLANPQQPWETPGAA